MNDPFDILERELVRAAARAHTGLTPWRARWPRRGPHGRLLALFVVLCLGVATGALAAAGVFQTGAPVGSSLPPTPNGTPLASTAVGVAIPASVRVLALRVSDPTGGPPWGLRVERTTRGLICVQPGRIVRGTIGALGVDGAFHNDGRFHPLSDDYLDEDSCGPPDAHGHAFIAAQVQQIPASAIQGSCNATELSSPSGRPVAQGGRVCPAQGMRSLAYGLLGPDAVSITYATASGRLTTRQTAATDGAYLVVGTAKAVCSIYARRPGTGNASVPQCGVTQERDLLGAGIRTVTYRSGRTCQPTASQPLINNVGGCPAVGYVGPATKPVTSAQVASPVTVHYYRLEYFCRTGPYSQKPCGTKRPPASRRGPGPPQYLIVISFIARVPVTNATSQYDIAMQDPRSCGGGTGAGPILSDVRAGQRVYQREFISGTCTGTVRGTVSYNTSTQPTNRSAMNLYPLGRTPQALVGRFTIKLPSR